MRTAIRNKLITSVSDVGTRVYEPYVPTVKTAKPYVVVKQLGDNDTNIRMGFDVGFQIWLYIDQTSFVTLDALESKVIRALSRKDLVSVTGQVFQLTYAGCGEDFYDTEWKALVRRLDFSTVRIRG